MAYHPLVNNVGGTPDERRAEADRILRMFVGRESEMTEREQQFIIDIDSGSVSPKQLFWLRDIKAKYID
jgi:hypothetical protein